ncbi:hypothetical protein ACT453_56930, partial [Bacillus sp. D-CC]
DLEDQVVVLKYQYAEVLPRSITGLHRFFKIYVKGFPGAAELRNQLMSTKSTDEVRALLNKFEASVNVVEGNETV